MILKKPYAFLIRHFRKIHLVILVLMGYIFYKTFGIFRFLSSRVSGKTYFDYAEIASKNINFLLILSLVVLLLGLGTLIYLLRYKKKPHKFYVITIIQYGIGLVLFIFLSSYIEGMNYNLLNTSLLRILRDVTMIYGVTQVPVMIFTFIRAIGFDIKKFDFSRDVADLEISTEDSEEFAFDLELDGNSIRTKLRKRLRYIKYYYLENKLIFYGIYAIVGVLVIVSFIGFILNTEKTYREGDSFTAINMKMSVVDSFKTYYSTNSSKVSDLSFFVITKVKMKNISNAPASFNTKLLYLSYTNTNSSTLASKYANNFVEFGKPYEDDVLASGEERTFIFVFEVPKEYYKNKLKLKVLTGIDYKDKKGYKFVYQTVKLRPGEDDDISKVVETKKIGEELSFNESYLGNTKLLIEDYQIKNSFRYNLYRCEDNNCNEKSYFINASTNTNFDLSIMRLKYKITYDKENYDSYYNIDHFIAKFSNLRFVINGKEYDNRVILKDISPYSSPNYSFIEVRSKAKDADKVYLRFNIRNKVYDYILYEKA